MGCDMCGKEGLLFSALIEGTELTVCQTCGGHGKVLKKIVPAQPAVPKKSVAKPEIIEAVVANYADLVRQAREKLGLTQKEFASKITEKESVVHKIETSALEPSIPLARKLEKLLRITLIEEVEDKPVVLPKGKATALTIGDMLKFKR